MQKAPTFRVIQLVFVFAVVAASCLSLLGQGIFGRISGTVTDASGAVVPNAVVKVMNVATGVAATLSTNDAGVYSATSLNPGVYNVQADAQGFASAVVKGVQLDVNANSRVDLVLQVGSSATTVEVKEEAPLLNTQQTSLGQTIDQRHLDQLPTLGSGGRNVYSLIPLTAGVSQQIGSGGAENNNLRINGDRPRFHEYLLDGTTIEQPVFGGQALSPSIDSIQEFRIEANSMSAEYGKSGGGVLIAVTKSGTNQFHGSAYEYNRNERLDARNFFENPARAKNPYDYNEFGGTIGGPIVKNKLFFFTDYQGVRQNGNSQRTGALVPNAAFRTGDLSSLCTAGFDASGVCLKSSQQIRYPGTDTPVPFNRIEAGSISPIALKILDLYPTSQTAGKTPGTSLLSYSSPNSSSVNRFNPRVDYNFSQNDHLFGTYHFQRGEGTSYDLVAGPAGRTIGGDRDYSMTIGWTHTFGPSLLNDFRFGFLSREARRSDYGQGFTSPADFGISGIPDCLASVPFTNGGKKCGTPGVSIRGYTGLETGSTLYEPTKTLQFSDTVTKLVGRHSLKVGGEIRHYAIDNYQPAQQAGVFSFDGNESGNPFADFLFGVLNTGSSADVQNAMLSSRAYAFAFFFQDDFKLTPRLTLNLGLRYQVDQSFNEIHHGIAFFNPFSVQWEQFGVNAPSTPFDTYKGWGPRFGFAWNPRSTFVVRAGYGIMYPGPIGHGRAGDGQPGPNLEATTPIPGGTSWSNLPAIVSPDPAAIAAPLEVNGNVNWSLWAPRKQTPTYVQLWNFTLEKQMGTSNVAKLGYVGSHGLHLPVNYYYNICQQSPQSVAQYGWDATTSPYCAAAAAAAAGGIWNLYVNPAFWGRANSNYHSLQATFDHRFSHGFSILANFTWSKLIDDSSNDWGGWGGNDVLGQDFYNLRAERSVSAGDVPVRFTIAPIVELPFGAGKKWLQNGIGSQVLGGWRASAIYTISDGYPFGITDNSYGYCNAAHTLSNRPDMIGNPRPKGFEPTLGAWFDTSAFDFSGTCPASNLVATTGGYDTTRAFGNAPRYFSSIRVPGINNLDLSLQKEFRLPVGESTKLRFQLDAFNSFNHPQFGAPASDPTSSTFGEIHGTSVNNRTMQLGLHLFF